jgi:hypothetical protein
MPRAWSNTNDWHDPDRDSVLADPNTAMRWIAELVSSGGGAPGSFASSPGSGSLQASANDPAKSPRMADR